MLHQMGRRRALTRMMRTPTLSWTTASSLAQREFIWRVDTTSKVIGFQAARGKLRIGATLTPKDCMCGVAAIILYGTGLLNSIGCNFDSATGNNFQRIIA